MTNSLKFNQNVELFKLLGSPVRLKILVGLKENGCNVKTMQENIGVSQSTISQHLKVLKMARIVQSIRKGNNICYKVIDPIAIKIINMIKANAL
ncbi:MAG: metalloregulator ArsR/SmtB family transcription factor [Candidatus Omnitrophica bacterium]|nr:metalloregulator ArsR/SmtB family transcription factor [Candidatus Omnitrophota bacterium]